MAWVRVEPDAPLHPKMMRVGVAGFGFFVASLCYSNHYLTDGFIDQAALPAVFPGTSPARALKLAVALTEAGLWEKADHGWKIHDYHKYQPTKTEVLADRAQAHASKVAGGQKRASMAARIQGRFTSRPPADTPAASPAPHEHNGQQTHQQETSPVPVPDPVLVEPRVKDKATTPRALRAALVATTGFDRFWRAYPKRLAPEDARKAWKQMDCEPITDEIIAALQRNMTDLISGGTKFIPYPASWLRAGRWKDEPPLMTTNGMNGSASRATGFARPPADDPRSKMPAGARKVSLRDDDEVTVQ